MVRSRVELFEEIRKAHDGEELGIRALREVGRYVRRPATRAPRMTLLAAALAVLLAGCGSSVVRGDPGPSPPSSVAGSGLCGSPPSLDRLVVRRRDAVPENHMRFSFPAEVTVTDATQVRAAARALCSLPKMPTVALSCTADFGIVYKLAFSAGERVLPTVGVDATGCEGIRGLGSQRWAARSPGFWLALGRAMGLSPSSHGTFVGNGPNG